MRPCRIDCEFQRYGRHPLRRFELDVHGYLRFSRSQKVAHRQQKITDGSGRNALYGSGCPCCPRELRTNTMSWDLASDLSLSSSNCPAEGAGQSHSKLSSTS